MTQKTTVIGRYEIELDTDMNGDGEVTGCWVSSGDYSASLQALEATGELDDLRGEDSLIVKPADITKIVSWAKANGY